MVNEQVTTVDLTAGTPSTVEFSGAYSYYWIDNKSYNDVYASLGTPEAGADGTYTIAAGSQLRISGGAFNTKLSLLGSGEVQVIASSIASCPFKSAQGGGGFRGTLDNIPDGENYYKLGYFVQTGTTTSTTVIFPQEFDDIPLIFLDYVTGSTTSYDKNPHVISVTSTDFTVKKDSGLSFNWIAFGKPKA